MAKGKLIIYFDKEHTEVQTVEEVLRLLKEGCTSGYDPNWEIIERTRPFNRKKETKWSL